MSSPGYSSITRGRKESVPYGHLLTMLFERTGASLTGCVFEDMPYTRVIRACSLQSLQIFKTRHRGYVYYSYLCELDVMMFDHLL